MTDVNNVTTEEIASKLGVTTDPVTQDSDQTEQPETQTQEVVESTEESQTDEDSREQPHSVKDEPIEKKYTEASNKIRLQGEELSRFEKVTQSMVEDNPESIHKLAKENPKLADKIVSKLWGEEHEVKTYQELIDKVQGLAKTQENEVLRESNPDLYAVRQELAEVKEFMNKFKSKEDTMIMNDFISRHKELSEDRDPLGEKRALLEEEMRNVKGDYPTRLEKAYRIIAADLPSSREENFLSKVGAASPSGAPSTMTTAQDHKDYDPKTLEIARKLGVKM